MTIRAKLVLAGSALVLAISLSGCNLSTKSSGENMDPPDVNYLEKTDLQNQQAKNSETSNVVTTELYLFDKNGYVVPVALALPNTTSVAKQAVEYLVKDGPVADLLPNSFQATLPAGTVVKSMDIQNEKAVVDLSKEFTEYQAEDEAKVLQSLVWTLTQFDSVKAVELRVEGQALAEMPVAKTSIKDGLTREIGINLDHSQVTDITNTQPLTVYYSVLDENQNYFVPVTTRVSNFETDKVTAVINKLIEGPPVGSKLASNFLSDVALLDVPVVQDEIVNLNFNENIFSSLDGEENKVSDQLMEELVLSLTEQEGIKQVAVCVNGSNDIMDESGNLLTAPVSRPAKVNTGEF